MKMKYLALAFLMLLIALAVSAIMVISMDVSKAYFTSNPLFSVITFLCGILMALGSLWLSAFGVAQRIR